MKITTWYRLGLKNIITVALYRILKKIGYYHLKLPIIILPEEEYFSKVIMKKMDNYRVTFFSFHSIKVTSPPNWFINPWGPTHKNSNHKLINSHWADIPDFIPELGDIKLVWELSRFDWLPKMAWAYKQGDTSALSLLELWLRDWVKHNPVNNGINWKCGQEASLRCLNLLASSLMIDDSFHRPNEGFISLLQAHASRIIPTLRYAMAQNNNHGTSEAAALFVVGEYLISYGNAKQKKAGVKWSKKGRFWLENRVRKLLMEDGSFSQHSVTYHRLFLDCLSFVELFRKHLKLKKFSVAYYKKMGGAVHWLYLMTDKQSGGAPNLGANDGAYLFNVNNADYKDFRPSIQLGAATFLRKSPCYENQKKHPLLIVFKIDNTTLPAINNKASLTMMTSGGYALLSGSNTFVMMRLPIYKFRPSHADALHVDFWVNGENSLIDDGSYSYNIGNDIAKYFSGTASHNTVQFDNRDQMPRLSRFLFGSWLKAKHIDFKIKNDRSSIVSASYLDYKGAFHQREINLNTHKLIITDQVSGFKHNAIMRWRLPKGKWKIQGTMVSNGSHQLEITCNIPLIRFKITKGWYSRYYMEKDQLQVLEVEIDKKAELRTEYSWEQNIC